MVEALMGVPVIVKVLCALALILVISRFCRQLAVSVAAATVVLAFWTGHSPAGAARIAWERFLSLNNLLLLTIVVQVIWLSTQMSVTGVMEDLVKAVRARVRQRASMAVLPAVIGLLPMPGGALFSAPLVDSCDTEGRVSPAVKARTNHWFRHIWEYWWPLYPGVLLALEITGLDVWQLVLLQFPLTLGAVGAGYFFLLRRIGSSQSADGPEEPGEKPPILSLVLPIVVVIAFYATIRLGYAGVKQLWPEVPGLNKYLPMLIGLFGAMAVLQRQRPLDAAKWRELLLSRRAAVLAGIVALVRIYGAFIEAPLPGGTLLVDQMRTEMNAWGIPMMGIVMVLPFISGLATGLSIGFVGASFPIVVNLLGADPSPSVFFSTVVLAFGFGYMGMLVSPVHVCLIVTSQYFSTRLLRNVAALLKPAAAVMAWVLVLHYVVRAILP